MESIWPASRVLSEGKRRNLLPQSQFKPLYTSHLTTNRSYTEAIVLISKDGNVYKSAKW
jgi:hypothetical protein